MDLYQEHDLQEEIGQIFSVYTLKKIRYLLLSETLLGFPNGSETLKEFPTVTDTEFF